MPSRKENTVFAKIKLLLSENINENWSIVSKEFHGTDYYFQIFTPPGLFGPKLLAEINVLDNHRRVTLEVIKGATKTQREILNNALNEIFTRLSKIPF